MNASEIIELEVPDLEEEIRLDSYISSCLDGEVSRSELQKWIKKGAIEVTHPSEKKNLKVKASRKALPGQKITIQVPLPEKLQLDPWNYPLSFPFLDKNFGILEKPRGIPVHPGPGHPNKTIVNALIHHFQGPEYLSDHGGAERLGIVNRLDLPTHGLMLVARNNKAHRLLSDMLKNREINKYYYTYCQGRPPNKQGEINKAIGRHPKKRICMSVRSDGKDSLTLYKVIKSLYLPDGRVFSLLRIKLITGRTHQIRVHLNSLGCPLTGDALYSRNFRKYNRFGLLLSCYKMEFQHPINKENIEVEINPSENFQAFESYLKLNNAREELIHN